MNRLLTPTFMEQQVIPKITSLFRLKWLVWFVISVGIFLRVVQYLLDRSLWIDEAFVALNIINRSYAELLQPLDYNQGAPFGFLVIEKFIVQVFGDSEYSLRLLPFISGIAALFLFYWVARRLSNWSTTVIALALFALCDRAIYYSAEVKQYSSDVAIALILYLLITEIEAKKIVNTRLLVLAIVGATAIWISHPSVFILAGTGLSLFIFAVLRREWTNIVKYLLVFTVWISSFIAFYLICLQQLTNNEALQQSWEESHNSFAPLPLSLTNIRWFLEKFFEVFNYPIGLYSTGLAALAFTVGCISLWKTRKETLFLLISPVVFTLFASGLHQYPFKGQLLLFIVPSMLLIIAEGCQQIIEKTRSNFKFFGIAFVLLLFFHPLFYVAGNLKAPQSPPHFEYQRVRENIKPVLSYVNSNQQVGDVLYLYYASQYAFKYYADRFNRGRRSLAAEGRRPSSSRLAKPGGGATGPGFSRRGTSDFNYDLEKATQIEPPENWFVPALPSYPPQLIVGKYARDNWSIFEEEVNQLRGNKRVWVIISHAHDRRSTIDEEDVLLYQFDRIGTRLDSFMKTEASAYLYDLSEDRDQSTTTKS